MKIKDLPINERPRERLINNGPETLSNEELLSIVLASGSIGSSAKDEALEILKQINDLSDLYDFSYNSFLKIKGIGNAKACLLLAILELSKRLNVPKKSIINMKFDHAEMVYNYYQRLKYLDQENFYCLYLDSKLNIIHEKLLFIGTVNYSMVHPRDVFKEAFKNNAVAFICVHNHPSGDLRPSKDDLNITNNLKKIGLICGVKLLDHIIIGKNSYYSFKENDQI